MPFLGRYRHRRRRIAPPCDGGPCDGGPCASGNPAHVRSVVVTSRHERQCSTTRRLPRTEVSTTFVRSRRNAWAWPGASAAASAVRASSNTSGALPANLAWPQSIEPSPGLACRTKCGSRQVQGLAGTPHRPQEHLCLRATRVTGGDLRAAGQRRAVPAQSGQHVVLGRLEARPGGPRQLGLLRRELPPPAHRATARTPADRGPALLEPTNNTDRL